MSEIFEIVEQIHRQADLLANQWQHLGKLIDSLEAAEKALHQGCRSACRDALDALGKVGKTDA